MNISSPISSLTSSFPNQSSLASTDSQDSSRLGAELVLHITHRSFSFPEIQLGILAEVLSTFRTCLNDQNSRVIHISLTSMRTLLPVLFQNSQALTAIGMQLLEDAIQHTTNSYVLTKVGQGGDASDRSKRVFSGRFGTIDR